MKIWNAMMAVLFLVALGASSCATVSAPAMTEEEEEEAIKLQQEQWEYDFSHAGGDND
jgi:hypothetical protein